LELPWPTLIPIDQKPLNRYFPLRGLPSRPACARNPYNLHLPAYLLFEAELYGETGRYEDELRLLDTAHDVMDTQGQLACEAELYRLRGSALLARGARSEEIERCYERSAEITRRQSAKFWELRTALSRARFWRDQGERIAARYAREGVRLVHRRFRHTRPQGIEGVA
jgi:tetratricopeptide (TPR) repeat protein